MTDPLNRLAALAHDCGREQVAREFNRAIGTIVRADRQARHMTQWSYAKEIGVVHVSSLCRRENGVDSWGMHDLIGIAHLRAQAGEGEDVYVLAAAILREVAEIVLTQREVNLGL